MAIKSIVGLPGNAKTLFTIVHVLKERERLEKQTGFKPSVCYFNFRHFNQEDVTEGLCSASAVGKAFDPEHNEFHNVKDWIELDRDDLTTNIWKVIDNDHSKIPQGAIIIIDECQKLYPTTERGMPPYIEFLPEHRHAGLNIILITQDNMFIQSNVRKLIQEEYELSRHGKAQASYVQYSPQKTVKECPKKMIKGFQFKYPKKFYGLYRSAAQHTQTGGIKEFWESLPVKQKGVILAFFALSSFSLYGYYQGNGLTLFADSPQSQQPDLIPDSSSQESKLEPESKPSGFLSFDKTKSEGEGVFYLSHYLTSQGKALAYFDYVMPDGAALILSENDLIKMNIQYKKVREGLFLIENKLITFRPSISQNKGDSK